MEVYQSSELTSKVLESNMKKLKEIGFWRATFCSSENLPFPTEMVDTSWNGTEKKKVIAYIKSIPIGNFQKGISLCRICQKPLGSGDAFDGIYVFPEKYEHYLEKHNVKPPQEFIDSIKGKR
jgi:hypothetical protein